tara:strand:+ start:6632 stop:6856 length:225 start_codon:yes stop_codon:yes gene_type:complete
MAGKATKTEHCGAKNSTASEGFRGLRADAKRESKKLRRANGKREVWEYDESGEMETEMRAHREAEMSLDFTGGE